MDSFIKFWTADIAPNLVSAWAYKASILAWSGWGLVAFLLWQFWRHGERVDGWIARFERFLLWIGFKRDKKYVEKDIRWRINTASKHINKEAEGVVTQGIEVVWVNQDNVEAFLRAGKVVVRMRHHSNQDRNTANAVTHYVKTGVLHKGKAYLTEKTSTALDLILAKKILSEEPSSSTALDFFSINTLEPSLKDDSDLENIYSIIEAMEDKGLLTRILLREVRYIGKKLSPRRATQDILEETKNFFAFLKPFADHKGGDDDIKDWKFLGENIRVSVIYVAKHSKITASGLEPYRHGLEQRIRAGCDRVYIFGRHKSNINAIKELIKLVQKENPGITVHTERYKDNYRGNNYPAVCVVLHNR